MPVVSMFYGIIISLYFFDTDKHHSPHVHVKYQEHSAVLRIPDGAVISGEFPQNKLRLVLAWIEIHHDELIADWELAVKGEQPFKIEPLR
jgi:hypothetical protein